MSRCTKCGHGVNDTQSFCTRCGAKNEDIKLNEKIGTGDPQNQPKGSMGMPESKVYRSSTESSAWIGILKSKTFWVVVAIVFLISLSYKMGYKEAQPQDNSPATQADSVAQCKKWGGEVVYDRNGNYSDCAINGRLGGE